MHMPPISNKYQNVINKFKHNKDYKVLEDRNGWIALYKGINSEDKICTATVPDYQLSLAIGNKGQNVRLAAKLTGYKIDIKPESGFYNEK